MAINCILARSFVSSSLLLLLLLLLQNDGGHAWHMSTVRRVPVQDFDPVLYYETGTPEPLIVTGVLSLEECDVCCDTIMSLGGTLQVDLQNQKQQPKYNNNNKKNKKRTITTTVVDVYEGVSLSDALDTILYESTSQNAYLSFSEGLLLHAGLENVHQRVTQAREDLFCGTSNKNDNNHDDDDDDDMDWFSHYFPPEWQPSDAFVLAGAGATSTLHRDPFEWTGTSLCLEGSKVWRFIDPKQNNVLEIDDLLQSYRLDSMAWEGTTGGGAAAAGTLSAGWQTDLSLYATRQHDDIPTAREWSEMENQDLKRQELLRIGSDTNLLMPNIARVGEHKNNSNNNNIIVEKDETLCMRTAIQQAGDVMLIPAHWWHQTYGLEPSAAIASQRCGGRHDAKFVLQHILNHRKITSTNAETILSKNNGNPIQVVEELLRLL